MYNILSWITALYQYFDFYGIHILVPCVFPHIPGKTRLHWYKCPLWANFWRFFLSIQVMRNPSLTCRDVPDNISFSESKSFRVNQLVPRILSFFSGTVRFKLYIYQMHLQKMPIHVKASIFVDNCWVYLRKTVTFLLFYKKLYTYSW